MQHTEETACAATVARAAPCTPMPKPTTKRRSRTMFRAVERMRKYSGTLELPSERRSKAPAL